MKTTATVTHANGLTFKVIDAHSYDARIARNVRQVAMADGTNWTVGNPVGWRGIEAAWQAAECGPQDVALVGCGGIAYIYCTLAKGHAGRHTP